MMGMVWKNWGKQCKYSQILTRKTTHTSLRVLKIIPVLWWEWFGGALASNTNAHKYTHKKNDTLTSAGIKNNTRAMVGMVWKNWGKQRKCSQVLTRKTTLSSLRVLKIIPVVHFR